MGTPAWQQREYERQQLLDKLKTDLYQLELKHGEEFLENTLVELARVLHESLPDRLSTPHVVFVRKVLVTVAEFVRGDEEFSFLMWQFLSDVVNIRKTRALGTSTRQCSSTRASSSEWIAPQTKSSRLGPGRQGLSPGDFLIYLHSLLPNTYQ